MKKTKTLKALWTPTNGVQYIFAETTEQLKTAYLALSGTEWDEICTIGDRIIDVEISYEEPILDRSLCTECGVNERETGSMMCTACRTE